MILSANNTITYGQTSRNYVEGAFEYGLIPSLGETELEKYTFSLYGQRELGLGDLGLTFNYFAYNFSFYNQGSLFGPTHSYELIHTVMPQIAYSHQLGTKWDISVSFDPLLSSNFKNGLRSEDLIINWTSSFSKKWGKGNFPTRLTLGIGRGILFGEPGLFPILSLQGKLTSKWEYAFGFPYSKVAYEINEKHSMSTKAVLSGIYANNSGTVAVSHIETLENTKLAYSEIDLGLEYNYHMSSGFIVLIRAGFSIANTLEILDPDTNPLFDFEANSSPYVTMGLKYSLHLTN